MERTPSPFQTPSHISPTSLHPHIFLVSVLSCRRHLLGRSSIGRLIARTRLRASAGAALASGLALTASLLRLFFSVAGAGNTDACGHQVGIKQVARDVHIVHLKAPVAQVLLGIIEDLAGLGAVLELWTHVAGDDGGVVEQVQETAAVAREDDLFLGAFDGGGKLGGIGLLELLSSLFC